jgi:hypothetical protein
MIINRKNNQGKGNKRLQKDDSTNSEKTAAWQNPKLIKEEIKHNETAIDSVIDAKDWVDNGSQL